MFCEIRVLMMLFLFYSQAAYSRTGMDFILCMKFSFPNSKFVVKLFMTTFHYQFLLVMTLIFLFLCGSVQNKLKFKRNHTLNIYLYILHLNCMQTTTYVFLLALITQLSVHICVYMQLSDSIDACGGNGNGERDAEWLARAGSGERGALGGRGDG